MLSPATAPTSSSGSPGGSPLVRQKLAMITQEHKAQTKSRKVTSVLSPASILAYNASSSRLLVKQLRNEFRSPRERFFLLLYEPASSGLAVFISVITWVSLILSALASQVETVRALTAVTGAAPWLYSRIGFETFFTAEVLVRILCHIPFYTSWRDPFLWIMGLSVLPFWGRFIGSDSLRVSTYLIAHERWVTTFG